MTKKVILKRNMLPVVIFAFTTAFSGYTIASNTCAEKIVLAKEDIASFESIAENIKTFIADTQKTLGKFIDDKDKTPYAAYVNKFNSQLILLEKTVIAPLKQKMAAANAHNPSLPSEYKEALKVTDSILTEVKGQIMGVANILKDTKYNPQNKKAGIEMAQAFQKHIEKLSKDYQSLDNQLDKLHNYLLKLELVNLANTIALVRQNLKQAKKEQEKPISKADAMRIARILKQKIDQK